MIVKERKAQYSISKDGSFVIQNYSHAKPFSNFLPAVAGPFGIPLWLFYVNRGQGIASFGVQNKDHAIMQFFPANRSYEQTALRGFRTFIKVIQKKEAHYYEPFQSQLAQNKYDTEKSMFVESGSFRLEEKNMSLGLQTEVEYFGVPSEPFAALARKVTIKNSLAIETELELIDGLPVIVPFGLKEFYLKDMSRTVEAWMQSEITSKKEPVAFFKLKSDPEDRPEFQSVDGAHFYTAFCESSSTRAKDKVLFGDLIVDPDAVFGSQLDLTDPRAFLTQTPFPEEPKQVMENKTPCAMSSFKVTLGPGEEASFYSFIGQSKNRQAFSKQLSKICKAKYFNKKREENKELVDELQNPATTISSSFNYNQYCKQTFLDNVLRGGYPYQVSEGENPFLFHIYSRKHGDLERDYNQFVVQPTYYSQGEGNFRDVNQNRRNDVWFEPRVFDLNVRSFFNLIQIDGYNPLVVEQLKLRFDSLEDLRKEFLKVLTPDDVDKVIPFLENPKTPGEIFEFLEKNLTVSGEILKKVFSIIFSLAKRWETARHGEGFWSEHWTYNLDLLDSFLEIYPDQKDKILFLEKNFTFYDNEHHVVPRSKKYVKLADGRIRQYGAVVSDQEKKDLMQSRDVEPDKLRTKNGKGKIYEATLACKMLCVIANKYATLDPYGRGVEMESDKPDWYDALNGLPGLFGSAISGTYELLRWTRFVREALTNASLTSRQKVVELPDELLELIRTLEVVTDAFNSSTSEDKNFLFWDGVHSAKEKYWDEVRLGISGQETKISFEELLPILEKFENKVSNALDGAYNTETEVCPTYFRHEVTDCEIHSEETNGSSQLKTLITPKKFQQEALPPFLEGPVHAIKAQTSFDKKVQIYNQVRSSDLFDRKLGMYCVTTSLESESPEIGRCRVFSPGWLENQSIFLHMEYKWLLELLRGGLYNEFFNDFQSALVPFQDPEVYGRSVFENSSFIASSAFSNSKLHGTGFVARLSGSTAEFMDIWLKMNLGLNPFQLNEKGKLEFHLKPILPEWIFTEEATQAKITLRDKTKISLTLPPSSYAFVLMGHTLVTYSNPKKAATFGTGRAVVKRITLQTTDKATETINGSVLSTAHATQLREGKIRRMDVELG